MGWNKVSDKISKGTVKDVPLGNIAVIMTVIGGGFTHEHKLYAVTKDLQVFKTREFDVKKLGDIKGTYVGKLRTLDIPDKRTRCRMVALDAIAIKAYKSEDKKFKLFFEGYLGIGDKPKLIHDILSLDF